MTTSTPLKLEGVLKILENFPEDYSRVAKAFNTTRAEVVKFLEENPQGEAEIRDSYLDSLTAYYKNWVRGGTVPENFSAPHALKILERERPDKWASRVDERAKAKNSKTKVKPKRALLDIPDNFFTESSPAPQTPASRTNSISNFAREESSPPKSHSNKDKFQKRMPPSFEFDVKKSMASPTPELMISEEDLELLGSPTEELLSNQPSLYEVEGVEPMGKEAVQYTYVAKDDLVTIEDI